MRAILVRDETQVAEARRGAVMLARSIGFSEEGSGRVAIVATELATNLVKHGAGGELLIGPYDDRAGSGVECLALDKGPGIADIETCLRDGHSTAGSAGTGLGAIVRQSHVFDIYSRPGLGTGVLARLQPGRPPVAGTRPAALWGAVNMPKPGEDACGDAWCMQSHPTGFTVMVADGLGHGAMAAEAAHTAVGVFVANHARPPADILDLMHAALRRTRGAAVAIAGLDTDRGTVVFAGVGNVLGKLIAGGSVRHMVTHNGTVGHTAKRMQDFTYSYEGRPLIILCSDGLATSWSLDRYPGLRERHPALIAGVLYRDYTHSRDDVTVLVAAWEDA